MKQVTRSKGGTAERTVNPESIVIPDLWLLGMWLEDSDGIRSNVVRMSKGFDAILKADGKRVLETWHLAHDLKRVACEAPDAAPQTSIQDAFKAGRAKGRSEMAIKQATAGTTERPRGHAPHGKPVKVRGHEGMTMDVVTMDSGRSTIGLWKYDAWIGDISVVTADLAFALGC